MPGVLKDSQAVRQVTLLTSLIGRNHWSLLLWLTFQRLTVTEMLRLS